MNPPAALGADDFPAFFEGVHGFEPFSWQRRAAAELIEGSLWPTLEAPTGAGKTSLLDCIVFALACQTGDEGQRTVPLRTFWCVDRRSVIDQVFVHVERLRDAIASGQGIVGTVRERLEAIDGLGGLIVQRWRGGLDESAEQLRITGPSVICSTVDQLGSRLLFRGYGTSRRSRPLDAALVGNDSLIVLDEAHIAEPFLQTLNTVRGLAEPEDLSSPTRPVRSLVLSATLPEDVATGFVLNDEERRDELIAQRLDCKKRVRLLKKSASLASEASKLARSAKVAIGAFPVIGVVANTVGEARASHADLVEQDREAILVIGPCRPFERDKLLERIPKRADRAHLDGPFFVVATQTIEVGVDLDFDGLVTEACPLPSLLQRLGRLDRFGKLYASTAEPSVATVVATNKQDPVYGETALETWQWLDEHADKRELVLDAERILALRSEGPPESHRPLTPILAEWHLEALVQTTVDPTPTPEIGPFLHGDEALESADVRVVWRVDLELGNPLTSAAERDGLWVEIARLAPPRPHEAIALPIGRARSSLRHPDRAVTADFGDLESVRSSPEQGHGTSGHRVLRWDRKEPEVIEATAIKPGDTLLLPASYGRADEYGWSPKPTGPVRDVGDLASDTRRMRVVPGLPHVSEPMLRATEEPLESLRAGTIDTREAYGQALVALEELATDERGAIPHPALAALPRHGELVPHPSGRGAVLLGKAAGDRHARPRRVEYQAHVDGVVGRVAATAAALQLAGSVAAALVEAARLHDVGKLDRRFQAWMQGSAHASGSPLAKSGRTQNTPMDRRLRAQAGWPEGARHELLSAALADRFCARGDGDEVNLITHLIACHHGQHRPFYGPEADHDPVEVEFEPDDSATLSLPSDARVPWPEHARRFAELNRRFGAWGLAALEAALVLSDRAVSAEEQNGP